MSGQPCSTEVMSNRGSAKVLTIGLGIVDFEQRSGMMTAFPNLPAWQARRSKGGGTKEDVTSNRSKALHRATLEDLRCFCLSDRSKSQQQDNYIRSLVIEARRVGHLVSSRVPSDISFHFLYSNVGLFEYSGFVRVWFKRLGFGLGLGDLRPRFWCLLLGALSSDIP